MKFIWNDIKLSGIQKRFFTGLRKCWLTLKWKKPSAQIRSVIIWTFFLWNKWNSKSSYILKNFNDCKKKKSVLTTTELTLQRFMQHIPTLSAGYTATCWTQYFLFYTKKLNNVLSLLTTELQSVGGLGCGCQNRTNDLKFLNQRIY